MKRKIKSGTEIENPIAFSSIAGQSEDVNEQKSIINKNLRVVWFLFSFLVFVMVGRIFYLQIIKGNYYQKIADNNRIKNIEVKAPRGLIVDSNGEILASNIPSFDLVFIPSEISKNEEEKLSVYSKIAEELNISKEEVLRIIESVDIKSREKYLIENGIDYDKALVLIEKLQKLPGIYLEKTTQRQYKNGEVFASILGYTGKINEKELEINRGYSLTDYIGKNGLEYSYEQWLKGQSGRLKMEINSDGSIKEELGIIPPVSGDKLILNIDSKVQEKAYYTLRDLLNVNKEATGASAVVLDPRNGAIKALVSLPSYDNNLFAEGFTENQYQELINNPQKPMMNRAIGGEYAPGSVFKPLLATAALEEGVISSDTVIDCSGAISIREWSFRDWKIHGKTDLNKAIAESCNVYFYSLGGGFGDIEGLGVSRMSKYSEYFGLGSPLGVDIPGEVSGRIPNSEWKFKEIGDRWYIGDSYHMSIGQGFMTTTPLQIASATAVIANEGVLYKPKIVNKIIKSNGEEKLEETEIIRSNFISEANFEKVKKAMRETVLSGSGRVLDDMETETAGKTGTAQFGNKGKTHSWYVSFAPYEDPEIVTAVIIESGGEGHDWAVPVTEQILRSYFNEKPEDVDWEAINSIVKNRNTLSEGSF
jgi:penicillin-binding protein 2